MTEQAKELIAHCQVVERVVSRMFKPIMELAQSPYCQRASIERLMPVLDRNFGSIVGFIRVKWRENNLPKEDLVEVAGYLGYLEEYFQAQKESLLAMRGGEADEIRG